MSFFNVYYRRLVGGNIRIAKTRLLPGQIVSFNYGKGVARKIPRLVFVLNAKDARTGARVLHGINLEWVPWIRFRMFLKKIVTQDTITLVKRKHEIRGPFNQILDRPISFYKRFVKPNVLSFKCYRTYKTGDMSNIRLWALDYRVLFSNSNKAVINELIGKDDNITEIQKELSILNEVVDVATTKLKDAKYKQLIMSRFGSVENFKNAVDDIDEYIDETRDYK